MESERIEVFQKVVRHIKSDLHKLKEYSSIQNKILKNNHCHRVVKDIQRNLAKLYTFDEYEFVRDSLGKNNWEDVLYYLNKFNENHNQEISLD